MPRQRHEIPSSDARDLLPLSRQTSLLIGFRGLSAGALTAGYDLVPLTRHTMLVDVGQQNRAVVGVSSGDCHHFLDAGQAIR